MDKSINPLNANSAWPKWSPKTKCFHLLSTSVNLFLREIYGDQCGDFVCGSVIWIEGVPGINTLNNILLKYILVGINVYTTLICQFK